MLSPLLRRYTWNSTWLYYVRIFIALSGTTALPRWLGDLKLTIPLTLGSWTLEFPEQGLALLALIPIWLYNGRQGAHNKAIQYACYAFYPAHMLILALLRMYL